MVNLNPSLLSDAALKLLARSLEQRAYSGAVLEPTLEQSIAITMEVVRRLAMYQALYEAKS